ncbi:MAG: hypothetical protein JXB32_10495 [Deltaproteobacteria bacterium]|nr:hypothetical protein [Deltaproteobacteria bacterium]
MIAQRPLPALRTAGEAAARRDLRRQVAQLERELTGHACSVWPRADLPVPPVPGGAPALLDVGELEALRDALAGRLAEARRDLAERLEAEERSRVLMEAALADPAAHRWVRVSHHDIGEPGCRDWHVRPRLGLIGMLAGWWRVVVSSGCPLQRGGCTAPSRRSQYSS